MKNLKINTYPFNNEDGPQVSYCKEGIKSTSLKLVDLEWISDVVTTPTESVKEKILSIREKTFQLKDCIDTAMQEQLKADIKSLKGSLPYFNMSLFKNNIRNNENFISTQHLLFDIDKLDDVNVEKEKLKEDLSTYCVFVSPSGNGLKMIVKLKEPITDYKYYTYVYKKLMQGYQKRYSIKADHTIDAARATYLSYDPELYLNPDSELVGLEPGEIVEETVSNTLDEDSDKDEYTKLLAGVSEGERTIALTKITGILIKKQMSLDHILEWVKGWNLKNHPSMQEDELIEKVTDLFNRYNSPIDEKSIMAEVYPWEFLHLYLKSGEVKCRIDYIRFKEYLEEQGFYYFNAEGAGFVVHINEDNTVKPVEEYFVKAYLLRHTPTRLHKNFLIKNEQALFADGKLIFLMNPVKDIYEATGKSQSVFFKNGFVNVTGEEISDLQPMSQLNTYIWGKSILNRNYKSYPWSEIEQSCEFYKFLRKVTAGSDERFDSLFSGIGYMLHGFNNPSQTRAVIFIDERIPESVGDLNGGSGKSLCARAIKIFNQRAAEIDGQNFSFNRTFAFQQIDHDSKIIYFDDVSKKFDFEKLFSVIADGVVVERKNRQPYKVYGIKTLISSNGVLTDTGVAFQRRKFEIEFSPYYNKDRTPLKEFGHNFFIDWDEYQWQLFDNLMLYAIKYYLQNNLVEYEPVNLNYRRLLQAVPEEFLEIMEDWNIELGQEHSRGDIYNAVVESPAKKNVTKATVKNWLVKYGESRNWVYHERPGTGNRIKWFWYTSSEPIRGIKFHKKK